MARIDPIADDEVKDPALIAALEFAAANGSPDHRMVKILGRTEAGLANLKAWETIFFGGLLPLRLKELCRIRFVALEECGYCASLRTERTRREGLTPQVVADLNDYEASQLLTDKEKAALRFTDRWRRESIANDATFEELRRHMTDEEIIELGVFHSFLEGSRFAKALDLVSFDEACELDPTMFGQTVAPAFADS